jgi:t-SNARE complex subunit (syntaxin)
MSREEYVSQEHKRFINDNPNATEDEIAANRI